MNQRLVVAVCWLTLSASALAFTVVKNINTGKPPVEKIMIFEKGKPTDHLTFVDDANCKMSFTAEGAVEVRIIGNAQIRPQIRWKPRGDLKETFDANAYTYLILTCRLEGNIKETAPNGKITEKRPDNLWLPAVLYNTSGEPVGGANLADVTEDERTPDKTTVLKIPMILFTKQTANNSTKIQAVGFFWSQTRASSNRDFRLVIDKIALAD
jgi:hypothetical protein